jgi:hypothetical protein
MTVGCCVAAALVAGRARAGNDEGIPVGDDAALTGNTVAAVVSDGSSLFYNPAGLARAPRDQIDVSASATIVRVYRLPGLVTAAGGERGNGSFTELVSVPSALAYVRAVGPRLTLGVGLFVPERSSRTIDVHLVAGGADMRLTTTLAQSLYFGSGGVGWRVSPTLRLGASLSAIYFNASGAAAAQSGRSDEVFATAQQFALDAFGAAAQVGAQWEPSPGWHVGLSLRSPILLLVQTLNGSSSTTSAGPGGTTHETMDVVDPEDGVHQVRPLRARLGVAWSGGASWLGVEVDLQAPLDNERVDEHRELTVNARAGGLLAVRNGLWVGLGAFTDRSPDDTPTGLLESRLDFYGGTVGLRLDSAHALASGERAPSLVFSTTIALRYAVGSGEVGGAAFDVAEGIPVANRAASATVHEAALHIGSSVSF